MLTGHIPINPVHAHLLQGLCNAQDISNIVHNVDFAVTKAMLTGHIPTKHVHVHLLQGLCNAQDISNMLWAAAEGNYVSMHDPVFKAAAQALQVWGWGWAWAWVWVWGWVC